MRLAKQVQKQQEKLIAGITNVTHVEDDLKVRCLWGGTAEPGCTELYVEHLLYMCTADALPNESTQN